VRKVVLVRGALLLTATQLCLPAWADTVTLPTPEAARVQQSQLILAVGGRPDRLLTSHVPGSVVNDEVVTVGLAGDGGVQRVTADQRLTLQGEGDYAVRERGPARSATSLSDEPAPVTQRGAVVWQGFSPGRRDLAARLVLDPAIEAPHLPLTVAVAFTGEDGRARPLPAGGRVPGPGTVTVTLTNVTSQPQLLPTARDVEPAAVARHLDRALAVARRPTPARLPSTDQGLPTSLTVVGAAQEQATQAVPLRLTGSLRLLGTAGSVSGPTVTATPDGGTFEGTLGGSTPGNGNAAVTFTAQSAGAGTLALDLTAVGALNAQELAPPSGFSSWAGWAAAGPPLGERRQALDLLVAVAATGARQSSYSPYLGADLTGTGSTTFRYAFAPPPTELAGRPALQPKWGAIALAGLALLLLLLNGALLWQRA
jgi:hypothetical protein